MDMFQYDTTTKYRDLKTIFACNKGFKRDILYIVVLVGTSFDEEKSL